MTSAIRYQDDVVAWAAEQATLLREGRLDQLDIEHLAGETGLSDFPESRPWNEREVLNQEWFPD